MAVIPPTFIDPDSPPRVKGQFLVQKWRDKYVFRSWPSRGGPRDARLRNWQRDQFGLAASMAANPWPIDYWTAVEVVRGTQMVPRDFLMMCIYGKGYVVEGPDGTQWTVADHGPPPLPPEVLAGMAQANPLGWPGPAMTWQTTTSPSAGFLRLKPVIITPDMQITGLQVPAFAAAATAHLTPVLYMHAGGIPTTLLASGPMVTGIVAGIKQLPFSAIYSPASPMMAWLGWIHTTAAFSTVNCQLANHAFAAVSNDTVHDPCQTVSFGNTQGGFWGY